MSGHYALQALLEVLPIGEHTIQEFVEGGPMVWLGDVAQLVGNDVVNGIDWCLDHATIEEQPPSRSIEPQRCLICLTIKPRGRNASGSGNLPRLCSVRSANFTWARFDMVVPEVADVLQEQHHKDVVLVLPGIDDPTKGVASGPRRLVDLALRNLVGNRAVSF